MSNEGSDPRILGFMSRLQQLDPGERARLKRSAGLNLAEARHDTLGLFYRLLPPGVNQNQEELYFMVATLYPLAEGGGKGNLGITLRQARVDKYAKGLDRRVERLLDAEESQLAFRLRQSIRFLQSSRVRVDWAVLLEDLHYWTHPDRLVQRRWARAYFAG